MLSKEINFLNANYPFMNALKVNLLINQAMLQMKEHKFKAAASDSTRIKPMLKDLGQYDKLIVVNARIDVCRNNKRQALNQVKLLHKIGADQIAKGLKSEISCKWKRKKVPLSFWQKTM